MLINDPAVMELSPIEKILAGMNSNSFTMYQVRECQLDNDASQASINWMPISDSPLQAGCYISPGFNNLHDQPYDKFPELNPAFHEIRDAMDEEEFVWYNEYGVCDSVRQVLDKVKPLYDPKREFVVLFTPVMRHNQSSEGGWRWHKWGEYIGNKDSQCEYLYDEPNIDGVLIYHIYERKQS